MLICVSPKITFIVTLHVICSSELTFENFCLLKPSCPALRKLVCLLQHILVGNSVLHLMSGAMYAAARCSVLQRIAVGVLHLPSGATCVAVRCSVLQCIVVGVLHLTTDGGVRTYDNYDCQHFNKFSWESL